MQAGELDLAIAMALDALPPSDGEGVAPEKMRGSWGHSGAQLADSLGRSADLWPEALALKAEYLRLHELRNRLVHGLHFTNGDTDGLLVESVKPKRERANEQPGIIERYTWNQQAIYDLYSDLQNLYFLVSASLKTRRQNVANPRMHEA